MTVTITVKQDDTLIKIVKREYQLTQNTDIFNAVRIIKEQNCLKNENMILAGQRLVLPDEIEGKNVTSPTELSNASVMPKTENNVHWSWNINGQVESSRQGYNVGDCWLLSTLNSMKDTEWGNKVIKDSIRPDGKGGAIVTLKLDGGKKTQEYHVTLAEINSKRRKGLCSKGDDDVAAIELAFEKHFGSIDGGGSRGTKIVELLCGNATCHYLSCLNYSDADLEHLLDEIEKNPNKYCTTIGALYDSNHLYGEHAYQLKKVETDKNGQRWLYVVNPWNSSKTLKISYEEYKSVMLDLEVIEPTNEPSENLKTSTEKAREERKKRKEEREKQQKIYSELSNAIMIKDDAKVKQIVNKIKTDDILYLFHDDTSISLVIRSLDLYKYGWGNGREKKDLIMRLVEVLCHKAQEAGVDTKTINETRKVCASECNAILFTNEEKIISALQNLHKNIVMKNN